ncbi:MAG: C/D box methylation guide ribonucleoprotein complex aNOP56 subunit [Candidatus Aenigmarchaeota archaeon]|nr:C/D box methylation guide ribonucleoprotein complex aNOP56 subunit [Candidatus Aenigmarchaeota archaeon]
MASYQVRTFIGIFFVDENKKIISFKPFPKDPKEVAPLLNEKSEAPAEIEKFVKENLLKYAIEYKFVKNQIEFNQFLTKVNSELTKQKIKESASRDNLIIHVNNAVEELDRSINIFVERLREWYSLHFPEMDRVIENHEMYVELIGKFGDRENFNDNRLNQFKEKSSGMEFNKEDIETVKLFSSDISKLYELRKEFTNYLSKLLKEIAPNFSVLAGDVIAAKLIAKAGGLERLSRMPSSTIQLLGSEKALFRFLKSRGRSKSPKYGLIYNHPLIQNSPSDKQGKIARLLASKLSIAARIDYYSKEYRGDQMKKELEAKVKGILSLKK